jgi:DoxX-like family
MTGNTNRTRWAGLIPTALVTLMLTASAAGKLAAAPAMVDGLIRAGIPPAAITPIAILELSCLALYLIPRTAVLGTLLLTGYFGGATLTHLIAGEALLPPLVIGLIIWAGAWFRVPALRALIPLRRMEVRTNAYRTSGHEPMAAEF